MNGRQFAAAPVLTYQALAVIIAMFRRARFHGWGRPVKPHYCDGQHMRRATRSIHRPPEGAASFAADPDGWEAEMLSSADYKQLSDRSARAAIACSAPTVAQALMALAFDYATRAARINEATAGQPQKVRAEPTDGFGD